MAVRPVGNVCCVNPDPRIRDGETPDAHGMSTTREIAKPRARHWLRRLGLAALVILGVIAVFHRTLFFEGTRYFIVRAAKQQHLDLSYDISGSIFTTLSVSNLHGVPTEPGPIQRLEIGTLNLRYSLIGLFRHGLPGLLKLVDIRNVYIEVNPGEPLPPDKERKPQQFKFPALFPDVLNVENVNFIAHNPNGDFELAGLSLSLLPDRPGELKIETLAIPGVHRWAGISGATTFRDRNLMLTDLRIGPEISLRKFNLDASKLNEAEIGLALDGEFFAAPTTITARVTDLNATNRLNVRAESSGLVFAELWKYFGLAIPFDATLDRLALTFEGKPEKPSSWSGEIDTQLSRAIVDQRPLGESTLRISLGNQVAKITLAEQLDRENRIDLQADAKLPDALNEFPKTSASGQIEIFAPDLVALSLGVIGDLAISTKFRLENARLSAQTVLDSSSIAFPGAELTAAHFTVESEKDLTRSSPFFETLVARIEGGVKSLRLQDYVVDSVDLALSSKEADVSLERLTLAKGSNTGSLRASYSLPADLKSWDAQPLEFDLRIDAPQLSEFVAPESGAILKGALRVEGKGSAKDRTYNGSFVAAGTKIDVQGLLVRTLDGRLEITDNQAKLSQLEVVFDDFNAVRSAMSAQLSEPFDYHGSLDAQLKDLSFLQPLFDRQPQPPGLGGSLRVTWQGQGNFRAPQHAGEAVIDLTGGRFGDLVDLNARSAVSYTPEFLNIPELRATAGKYGEATLSLFWKDNRLSIFNLSVRQKRLVLLEGSAEIPLHLYEANDPDKLLPDNEPIKFALRTNSLDLRALFAQLDQKPPLTGVVNLEARGEGTLQELSAKTSLRATRIQSPEAPKFDPADLSLDLELQSNRMRLDGTVRQKLIEPLRIWGNVPFDLVAIKKNRQIDPQTPIDLHVAMPRSSVAFLATLVPAIRQIRGTAAVDVNVTGTIAQPSLSGTMVADLPTLRFTDPSLPPVANGALRLNFTRDRVVIDGLNARVGGGTIGATGTVVLAPLNNPALDLRLTSRNALVMQNDDLSVRASADLLLSGPLNAASVTGNVLVTRSGFFKNIDILPIGLPGRPAPQPPEQPTTVSFPDPPMRDWKFDIAIRTEDAFRVQSNLANGRITMDLKFGGTGLEPWLDGTVHIEQLTATLPFSRLQIESGFIYFVRDDPFVPRLDLRGTSTIRDYRVTVFISGPITNPQAVFSSDPPLPQAEIVSLIATGSTTRELSNDPNALAGRAAFLLLQKAYRSIFRRNKPPAADESFLSRVQFDFGVIDPQTGKQSASVSIPMSERFMLVGGLGVGGNFRGQLKYLIRFK